MRGYTYIETKDQNQAFMIFETLNARGKSLATSDLLKNHIIRTSKEEIRIKISEKWERMIENLEMNDPTKFVKNYWNSHERFTRDKTLYKNLSRKYKTSSKVENLIEELDKYSSLYKSLVSPDLSPHSSREVNKLFTDLNALQARTFYPLIISMSLRNIDDKSISKVLNKIVNYYVRNIVIGGKTPNSTEVIFAHIAEKFSNDTNLELNYILEEIEKNTDNDEEFIFNFTRFKSKNSKVARYILIKLEAAISGNEKIIDPSSVHWEHIMPKSNTKWDYDEEVHEDYKDMFGNFTLLGDEYNIEASNNVYTEKLILYEKSEIKLTRNLLEYEDWGIDEIVANQKYMAELAVKIW